jgi:hypothetical protein
MCFRKNIVFLFIASFFQINSAISQNSSVETKIDTNVIIIGDQTGLTFHLKKDSKVPVDLPAELSKIAEGIETIGLAEVDSNSSGDITLKYLITSFDTGMYYLPPLPFISHHHGITDTLYSKSTYLEVIGVAIDTTGTIRDIKANAKAPVTFLEVLPYIILVILLGLVGWLLYRYIKKKKSEAGEIIPEKISEPAYITALRELDKIKAQKLWQQKQVKEYYVRITHTIRWYISKHFNIHALEETSDEILDQLGFLNLNRENYEILSGLLNLADLVKFAKGEPNPDENIVHLDNAYDFIKKTKEPLENVDLEISKDKTYSK